MWVSAKSEQARRRPNSCWYSIRAYTIDRGFQCNGLVIPSTAFLQATQTDAPATPTFPIAQQDIDDAPAPRVHLAPFCFRLLSAW